MFEDENEVPQMSQEEIDIRNELNKEIFEGDVVELPLADKVTASSDPDNLGVPGEKVLEKNEPDPWDGIAPVLRQAIESIQTKLGSIDSFEVRIKQAESRVGGIDNRLRDMKAAFPAAKQPTRQDVEAALASSAKWKVFMEDFPDHADAFKDILIATNSGAGQISPEQVAKIREEMNTDFEGRLNKQQLAFELKLLRMKYRNHAEIAKEPEFMPWLQAQPQELKEKYGSWDAMDGIDVLDQYTAFKAAKAALPNTAKERQERLNEAAENHRSTKAVKVKSEAEMTDKEYREHISKQIWGK